MIKNSDGSTIRYDQETNKWKFTYPNGETHNAQYNYEEMKSFGDLILYSNNKVNQIEATESGWKLPMGTQLKIKPGMNLFGEADDGVISESEDQSVFKATRKTRILRRFYLTEGMITSGGKTLQNLFFPSDYIVALFILDTTKNTRIFWETVTGENLGELRERYAQHHESTIKVDIDDKELLEEKEIPQEIKINSPVWDTEMVWDPEVLALAEGRICICIQGVSHLKELFKDNPDKLLALIPIMTKRSLQKQSYQDNYQDLFTRSKNNSGQWEENYVDGQVIFQNYLKVLDSIAFRIPDDPQIMESIKEILIQNSIYSDKKLTNYLKPRRTIQLLIGRVYALQVPLPVTWDLSKQSFSNVYAKPKSFSGIPKNTQLPLNISLVELSEDVNFKEIYASFNKLKKKINDFTEPSPLSIVPVSEVSEPELEVTIGAVVDRVDEILKTKYNFIYTDEFKTTLTKIALFLIEEKRSVVLTGKPGTGKSIIAEAFAEVAVEMNIIKNYSFVTATSNWSAYETIGGYELNADNKLVFRYGLISEVLLGKDKKEWIIIDELNRAHIDKAFGPMYSILAGKDVRLFEKAEDSGETKNIILPGFNPEGKTKNFRIIGTMNSADKASLFQLSYAFKRRFVFIPIEYSDLDLDIIGNFTLQKYFRDKPNLHQPIQIIAELWNPKILPNLPLGPALLVDFIRTTKKLMDSISYIDDVGFLFDAFELILFENLEILNREESKAVETIIDDLGDICNLSDSFEKKIYRILKE